MPCASASQSAQRGEAFLLQGGDCAETFEGCESDRIAKQLKVLLQVSLVLLHGLKRPIVRVGRIAGQYAKPRSADTETRDGVTLRATAATTSIIPNSPRGPRTRSPACYCVATSARRLTLNFVRALIDGGFADLHHPEYWDLTFSAAFAGARGLRECRAPPSAMRWISSKA